MRGFLCCLLLAGCHESTAPAAIDMGPTGDLGSPPAMVAPPPRRTFAPDIPGQLDRIDAECAAFHGDAEVDRDEIERVLGFGRPDCHPQFILSMTTIPLPLTRIEQLQKNPDRYAGMVFSVRGKLEEIGEGHGAMAARFKVTGGMIYVVGRFTSDFVAGDSVSVIGYMAGAHTYTSEAGWKITLPAVAAVALVKVGSPTRAARLLARRR